LEEDVAKIIHESDTSKLSSVEACSQAKREYLVQLPLGSHATDKEDIKAINEEAGSLVYLLRANNSIGQCLPLKQAPTACSALGEFEEQARRAPRGIHPQICH
jgi:hypothetical protein